VSAVEISDRDQEALDTLPNGALGQAFWPPKRLAALRKCVKLITAAVDGLSTETQALALINLADAGSIPQSLILKVWQQGDES
jgi:hypothetical protein